MWACADATVAPAPAEAKTTNGAAGPSSSAAEDYVAWKSHIGVQITSSRVIRATSKGWGRSGTLSDALVTRHGDVEGFTAAIPTASSLFIGFTTLQATLYAASRAHQDDLDFALRVSADGSISYHSKQRAKQFYHAQQMESEAIGSLEKGDVLGMRLSPDKNGFSVFKVERVDAVLSGAGRPAAAGGGRERMLKTFSEVLSFPMKVMVVLGSSGSQIGPVCWLRRPGAAAKHAPQSGAAPARNSTALLPPPLPAPTGESEAVRVVKGRHAGELLDKGTVDETGNVLLMRESGEGSWAAGVVQMVKPKGTAEDQKLYSAAADLLGAARHPLGGAGSSQGAAGALSLLPARAAQVGASVKEAARARAATAAALQPKAVGKGERLLPKSARLTPGPACARGSDAGGQPTAKRSRRGDGSGTSQRDSAAGTGHGASRDDEEPLVPLSRAAWSMACLARYSPFLTDAQRQAIAQVTELHRAVCAVSVEAAAAQPLASRWSGATAEPGGPARAQVRLSHIRLLLAAIDQLVPGAASPRTPSMPTCPLGLPPFFMGV
jgi:hypothetical protein